MPNTTSEGGSGGYGYHPGAKKVKQIKQAVSQGRTADRPGTSSSQRSPNWNRVKEKASQQQVHPGQRAEMSQFRSRVSKQREAAGGVGGLSKQQRHHNFLRKLGIFKEYGNEAGVKRLMSRREAYRRRMQQKGEKVSAGHGTEPGGQVKHRGGKQVSSGHGTQPGGELKRVMHEGKRQEAIKRRMERKRARQ